MRYLVRIYYLLYFDRAGILRHIFMINLPANRCNFDGFVSRSQSNNVNKREREREREREYLVLLHVYAIRYMQYNHEMNCSCIQYSNAHPRSLNSLV